MYARLAFISLGPGMCSKAQEIGHEMIPKIKSQKGFKSVNVLAEDETGEYCIFVLWETRQDAEVAKEAIFPILQSKLAGIAKGPPTLKLFEVIGSEE